MAVAHSMGTSAAICDGGVPDGESSIGAGARTNHLVSNGDGGGGGGHLPSIPSSEELAGDDNGELSQQDLRLEFPFPSRLLNRRRCSQSFIDAKEQAYARLMAELSKAQSELKLRDEEWDKLSKLRGLMEEELTELTASLFEEANKSVQDAHKLRMKAEKQLEDASNQIEILQAEVAALKHQMITSTPSCPNRHLHPQIRSGSGATPPAKKKQPFWKKHRRSTSHHEFSKEAEAHLEAQDDVLKCNGITEMNSVCCEEFRQWKEAPCIADDSSAFLSRVFKEDIQPCFNLPNTQLADRVLYCVQHNTLSIEPIPGDSSPPRSCYLSQTSQQCKFKIRLEDDDEWYSISQTCRNRIAAVCDFYTYIRYICQNLVKSADTEMFQEITRLRLQMATSRLGC